MNSSQIKRANEILAWYTLSAAGTGAIPVPASSAVIIAQNSAMIPHIASTLGVGITVDDIVKSLSFATTVNAIARNFFIEGAKLLSWGTGSAWALAALSALGATTAGIQTYILGCIAIEIAKNSGKPLPEKDAQILIEKSKANYGSFITEWSNKKIKEPK